MKQAIAAPNSSNVTRALKTASLGSATQTRPQRRTLRFKKGQLEQSMHQGNDSPQLSQ
ncbi:hypothetical protein sync_0193 [Synechococcus sp. CC9311]|nr:hypothetical protein sync_0193 [Synechococcus sp. CC9311]